MKVVSSCVLATLLAVSLPADLALAQFATVARTDGDPAPGTGGVNFLTFRGASFNATCDAGFEADLNTASAVNEGAWLGRPGALTLVGLRDDAAPGTGGAQFLHVGLPDITPSGEFVFAGYLFGPGVTTANNYGVWVGTPGAIQLLARTGDPAPGTPAGEHFASTNFFYTANSPASGGTHAAFATWTEDSASAIGSGIWAGSPGDVQLVLHSGDVPPGFPAGWGFGQALSAPVINRDGILAFSGVVEVTATGEAVRAAWTGPRDDPQLILRTGDTTADMPLGMAVRSCR